MRPARLTAGRPSAETALLAFGVGVMTAFLFLFAPAVVLMAIILLKVIARRRNPLGDIHIDQL
jgi:hypothetical protein